jgi:hypothetical protein
MDIQERIKHLVKTAKKTQGVQQGFIAKTCGFDPIRFSNIINGHSPLRPSDIEKICIGMNVSPNFIFGWDDQDQRGA